MVTVYLFVPETLLVIITVTASVIIAIKVVQSMCRLLVGETKEFGCDQSMQRCSSMVSLSRNCKVPHISLQQNENSAKK